MPVLLLAVLEVGLAVVPETDLVDVAHVARGGGALHGLDQIIVRGYALGKMVENIFGVILEGRCVGLEEEVSVL